MKFSRLAAIAFASCVTPAHAQSGDVSSPAPAASAVLPLVDGEVKKVDKEQDKVTLKHGPITNLDMPDMTMIFRANDPRMLDGIKQGDKVQFTADKVNGAFTVTSIQPAK